MKYSFLFVTLMVICNCAGQTYDLVAFDYDVAGNQIKRHLIDLDNKKTNENPKSITDLTASDLIKSDIYDDIKYYPNPVKEELYVFWDLVNGNDVESIQLYNINGKLISSFDNLRKAGNFTVPFQVLPEGMYSVTMIFKNGEKKSLKVIKNGS